MFSVLFQIVNEIIFSLFHVNFFPGSVGRLRLVEIEILYFLRDAFDVKRIFNEIFLFFFLGVIYLGGPLQVSVVSYFKDDFRKKNIKQNSKRFSFALMNINQKIYHSGYLLNVIIIRATPTRLHSSPNKSQND